MAVPSFPAPAQNRTRAGFRAAADDLAGTDIIVAAGDFTGNSDGDDLFTLAAHGLVTGDFLYLLYKSAVGVVLGGTGTEFKAKVINADDFQLTQAGDVIEHSADGTAVFLKGRHDSAGIVQTVILPNIIVANGDFTGLTAGEDAFIPTVETGTHGLEDTNSLKLLYKAAAGVLTGIAAGTTVFAKSVTATDASAVSGKFELAATSGGADIENTADGLAVFVKLN